MLTDIIQTLENEIFTNGNIPDVVLEHGLHIDEVADVKIKSQSQTSITGICVLDITDAEEDSFTYAVNFVINLSNLTNEIIWGDFEIYNEDVGKDL